MNPWIAVISGFVLGWALEFFIDCVWWGNRRICGENEEKFKKLYDELKQKGLNASSASYTDGLDLDHENEPEEELSNNDVQLSADEEKNLNLKPVLEPPEAEITPSETENASFSENYHKKYDALKNSSDLTIKNLEADLAVAGKKYEEDLGTYQKQQEKLEEKIFKIQTELELFANNTEVQPLRTEFVATNNELIKERSAVEILLEENKHLTGELETLQKKENSEKKTDETLPRTPAKNSGTESRPGAKPESLSESRPEQPDDLKKIKGIGPKIEQSLNKLGIYFFQQIAEFTPDNRTWVNSYLRFSGRIEREDWINQARGFASDE